MGARGSLQNQVPFQYTCTQCLWQAYLESPDFLGRGAGGGGGSVFLIRE